MVINADFHWLDTRVLIDSITQKIRNLMHSPTAWSYLEYSELLYYID